jgi:hypothetical protein
MPPLPSNTPTTRRISETSWEWSRRHSLPCEDKAIDVLTGSLRAPYSPVYFPVLRY